MITAFVNNAIIELPNTDKSYTVREWLESGHPPDMVVRLADQVTYGW
jgi:hypothetical protein